MVEIYKITTGRRYIGARKNLFLMPLETQNSELKSEAILGNITLLNYQIMLPDKKEEIIAV